MFTILRADRRGSGSHPTVRAENFWARPAHSRQRRTSSGQTRILSQRGNSRSKLRTNPKFAVCCLSFTKAQNLCLGYFKYVWVSTIVLAHKKCQRWSRVLLVYFTSSPRFCLPNRLCRHSPYFWQCNKPPCVPDLFPSLSVSSNVLPLFNSTSFLHTPSLHTWFCRLDPLSDAGCSLAGREVGR